MAGKIPQHFIDELLNQVDIVDVIDSRVPLKKAGSEYQACCPFHSEKTPSFTVSPSKQFYHCFGCGAHGTAIGFLMEYESHNFPEAIEELAAGINLEVPREGGGAATGPSEDSKIPLYDALAAAADYYQRQLREHKDASRAVDYLRSRGLSGDIAKQFGIGFAPDGWNGLLESLGSTQKPYLITNGMLIEKSGSGIYDRFRDRIMFPIRDRRGRVIAFGGRTLGDDKAKYLNSPETPIFHKGSELYGLYELRKSVRNPKRILVVEGYMDVVALAQFDIRNVVATLGTATTPEHLQSLYRVVDEVVFCFDGDRAGRQAAWRALQNTLPVIEAGREARFLFLPDGEDPDTLIRKEGQQGFESLVNSASSLSDYLFKELLSQVDMSTLDGRTRLASIAKPLIEQLPGGLFREAMIQRLEQAVRIEGQQVRNSLAAPVSSGSSQRRPAQHAQQVLSQTPVRKAIAILLHQPSAVLSVDITSDLSRLALPGVPLLVELIAVAREYPKIMGAALLERFRGQDSFPHLEKLARWKPEKTTMEANLGIELNDVVQVLEKRLIKQRLDLLDNKPHLDESEKNEYRQLTAKLSG